MSKTIHWGILTCPCSNTIGFIRIGFTILDLWSVSQGDLLQDCSEQRNCTECHVSLVDLLSLIFGPPKSKSVPFLEHLQEFHLDLCSPRYFNYPQVSCLWMNSGRGWNPNVEGSYLPENSEYEAKFGTKCKELCYHRPPQFSPPDPFLILIYSECTKTYQF